MTLDFGTCGVYGHTATLEDKETELKTRVQINVKNQEWEISDWHSSIKHKGYGTITLCSLCRHLLMIGYPLPTRVTYIWNGANEYVLASLERQFDAKCIRADNGSDDSWDAHIYELNVDKFIAVMV